MDKIDCFYYINLKIRPGKRKNIETEMNRLRIPQNKRRYIEAVYNGKNPALGCTQSHLIVLEHMKRNSHNICIVFEDDAEWTNQHKSFNVLLADTFEKLEKEEEPWHIVMLGGHMVGEKSMVAPPHLYHIDKCQHSHSYMIHCRVIPSLKKIFEKSKNLLQTHGFRPRFALDIQWIELQPQKPSRWYMIFPIAFKQRAGYSDISKRKLDRYREGKTITRAQNSFPGPKRLAPAQPIRRKPAQPRRPRRRHIPRHKKVQKKKNAIRK